MAQLDLTNAYRKHGYLLTTTGRAYDDHGPAETFDMVVTDRIPGKNLELNFLGHKRMTDMFNNQAAAYQRLNDIGAGRLTIDPEDRLNQNLDVRNIAAGLFQVEIIPIVLTPDERRAMRILGAVDALSYDAKNLALKLDPSLAKMAYAHDHAPWLTDGGFTPALSVQTYVTMNSATLACIVNGDLSLNDAGALLKDNAAYRCTLKGVAEEIGKAMINADDRSQFETRGHNQIAVFRLYSVNLVVPGRLKPEDYVLQDELRAELDQANPRIAAVVRQHLKL